MTPSEQELAKLLIEARNLGLMFDIGNAYIRRSYIEQQESIKRRIDEALSKLNN